MASSSRTSPPREAPSSTPPPREPPARTSPPREAPSSTPPPREPPARTSPPREAPSSTPPPREPPARTSPHTEAPSSTPPPKEPPSFWRSAKFVSVFHIVFTGAFAILNTGFPKEKFIEQRWRIVGLWMACMAALVCCVVKIWNQRKEDNARWCYVNNAFYWGMIPQGLSFVAAVINIGIAGFEHEAIKNGMKRKIPLTPAENYYFVLASTLMVIFSSVLEMMPRLRAGAQV